MSKTSLIAAILLVTTATTMTTTAADLRMVPTLGDARYARLAGATNQNLVSWMVRPPDGVHSGMTATAWVRLSKYGTAELTTACFWCPETIVRTGPDILEGLGGFETGGIDLSNGPVVKSPVTLTTYPDAPQSTREKTWPNGVCTVAGTAENEITVSIGGNEVNVGPGAFNKNCIAGPDGSISITGTGLAEVGVSKTPCYQFYQEIDGVMKNDGNLGVTPESTVTNVFAFLVFRLGRTGDGKQMYRSDLGRPEAFDALSITKTNGVWQGYSSKGHYMMFLTGVMSNPPYDVEFFDHRVFPYWMEDDELERVHANGVQELTRRAELP